jgi:hypothetical protein
MSIWTHVIGSIRFEGLIGAGDQAPDLGNQCEFDDDEEIWDKCDIPLGSEGSLKTTLWTNPDDCCLARWTATIFGDLRSYEDEDEIIDYFNRIVEGKFVRQGCFSFHVGDSPQRLFVYDREKKHFVER